jgi:hypothetical protein
VIRYSFLCFNLLLAFRENKGKSGATARFGSSVNFAFHVIGYFFRNGQPDAGAWILRLAMQALENLENLFPVFRLKANAVAGI